MQFSHYNYFHLLYLSLNHIYVIEHSFHKLKKPNHLWINCIQIMTNVIIRRDHHVKTMARVSTLRDPINVIVLMDGKIKTVMLVSYFLLCKMILFYTLIDYSLSRLIFYWLYKNVPVSSKRRCMISFSFKILMNALWTILVKTMPPVLILMDPTTVNVKKAGGAKIVIQVKCFDNGLPVFLMS